MKTNPLAIVSAALGVVAVVVEVLGFVILGIFGLSCIGAGECPNAEALIHAAPLWSFLLPASALVTGIIALRQIARSQRAQSGTGSARLGTVLGGLQLAGNVAIVVAIFLAGN